MLSSSNLHKNKEVLTSNGGGKLERKNCFYIVRRYMLLLNMTLCHLCVWVGKSIYLSVDHTSLKSLQFGFGSYFLVKCCQVKMLCHRYVQEKSNLS